MTIDDYRRSDEYRGSAQEFVDSLNQRNMRELGYTRFENGTAYGKWLMLNRNEYEDLSVSLW